MTGTDKAIAGITLLIVVLAAAERIRGWLFHRSMRHTSPPTPEPTFEPGPGISIDLPNTPRWMLPLRDRIGNDGCIARAPCIWFDDGAWSPCMAHDPRMATQMALYQQRVIRDMERRLSS